MNAEASTSQLPAVEEPMEVDEDEPGVQKTPVDRSNEAPERPLPQTQFYSVEYPGYVQDASVPKAVQNLGGQARLDQAFKRMAPKTESLIELALHPENPFAHPIPGDVVNTNNLVLKVIKRRRKRREGEPEDALLGEYKAEIVGVAAKTVRFRGEGGRLVLLEGVLTIMSGSRYGGLPVPSRP
jgi:general transcription factor 3C polypeptide 5 (transcription factor C subunit 1)